MVAFVVGMLMITSVVALELKHKISHKRKNYVRYETIEKRLDGENYSLEVIKREDT